MGPAEGSGAAAGRVARPGTGGVVSRPGLFERLGASARVTVVSAPPGSGKTVLLRSWIGEAGLGESVAWVSVGPGETDPQQFWLSVLGALRRTSAGSELVQPVTAAPDLDGWAIVERLLKDLAPLNDRIWLVIDDVHELGSDEVSGLHRMAAGWYAGRGFPVEAVRHAQGGQDWGLASRLLADHWPGLYLDGQAATVHELLAGFPAEARAADAELAARAAADELAQGSLEEAKRYLTLAALESVSVPAGRRGRIQTLLGVVGLLLARQRGNPPAVAEESRRLLAAAETPDATRPGLGEDLRALALINLGIAEAAAARFEEAEPHLEQGVALALRIGRPYLEFLGLAHQAALHVGWSFVRAAEYGRQAVELAERHGWTDEPAAGMAFVILGGALVSHGRPEEAESWIQRGERTVRTDAEPAVAVTVHSVRGVLELARGRDGDALAAFRAAERLAGLLAAQHYLVPAARAWQLVALVRLGETERAEQALAELGEEDRDRRETRTAVAALRLAQDDPQAAIATLAPTLDASTPIVSPTLHVQSFLLEAIARDALGDPGAAERALERALDVAEPDGLLLGFLLHPGLVVSRAGCALAAPALRQVRWEWARESVGAMQVPGGFSAHIGEAELADRRAEREVLDRLLDAVRGGESRALVVHGEPGTGKTVLLEYLAERAADCHPARTAGIQSEMELAFAGLHQLCAPLLVRHTARSSGG